MAKVSLDRIFLYDVTICESKMPEQKFEKIWKSNVPWGNREFGIVIIAYFRGVYQLIKF